MTEKRFEVTFNDSDFHLKDNETGEEFKLIDEKVCYDYITDRWNALHEENKELQNTIETICKDFEESHGMNIRNADWFTAW